MLMVAQDKVGIGLKGRPSFSSKALTMPSASSSIVSSRDVFPTPKSRRELRVVRRVILQFGPWLSKMPEVEPSMIGSSLVTHLRQNTATVMTNRI